ncbi:hypothetical protein SUGI_0232410 [Cryptomeria japonica]|nr:hypothetical protein SUGI_0232410 [Cryptomeria japonica]
MVQSFVIFFLNTASTLILNASASNVEELRTKIALAVQQRVGKKCLPRDVETANDADIAASTSTSVQRTKSSSLLPRDSYSVGIDSKVEDIVGLWKNPQVAVIAVVGMGALGKTFLLQ